MKVQVATMEGLALRWAIGMSKGLPVVVYDGKVGTMMNGVFIPLPDYQKNGMSELMQKHQITVAPHANQGWIAYRNRPAGQHREECAQYAASPELAVIRCAASICMGYEVDVPIDLLSFEQVFAAC